MAPAPLSEQDLADKANIATIEARGLTALAAGDVAGAELHSQDASLAKALYDARKAFEAAGPTGVEETKAAYDLAQANYREFRIYWRGIREYLSLVGLPPQTKEA